MGILKAISERFIEASMRRGRRQARQQLLHMSNRQLHDFGISRLKLLEGISAWPWSSEPEDCNTSDAGLKPAPVVTNIGMEVSDVAHEQRQVA